MKRKLLALILITFMVLVPGQASSESESVLMFVGEVLPLNSGTIWRNLVKIANRNEGENVIIPAAHQRPRVFGQFAQRAFQHYGEDTQLIPIAESMQEFSTDHRFAVNDREFNNRIRQSKSIYFVGGAPQRLSHILLKDDGSLTQMAESIRFAYKKGSLIIGGIPGVAGVATDVNPMDVLRELEIKEEGIYKGLNLFDGWVVDQLFFSSARFATTIIAMHQLGIKHGIGVDIETAAVAYGNTVEVLGERGIIVLDLSKASLVSIGPNKSLRGIQLSYLENGDVLHTNSMRVVPHTHKLEGFELNPVLPNVDSNYTLVSQDMFAPGEIVDLMYAAVEGDTGQAVGYAYYPDSESGYRFRFYTKEDTLGWLSTYTGEESKTLINVYLDIDPTGLATNGEVSDSMS